MYYADCWDIPFFFKIPKPKPCNRIIGRKIYIYIT